MDEITRRVTVPIPPNERAAPRETPKRPLLGVHTRTTDMTFVSTPAALYEAVVEGLKTHQFVTVSVIGTAEGETDVSNR